MLRLQTKYTLYEGGVRGVAALWSTRLQKTARVSNQLVHITDWLPTLYSAAGGDLRDLGEIDGIDQWRVLSEGYGRGRDKLLLNIDEVLKTEGAIYSRFKLLRGNLLLISSNIRNIYLKLRKFDRLTITRHLVFLS